MLKGIVFDLDGTLVDSLRMTFDAFNHAIMQYGKPKLTPKEIMHYFGPGEIQIFAKIVGEENAQPAYNSARAYMVEHMGRVPLHEGVEDLLERVKSAEIPIGIFTGRGWDTTEMILRHHRILDRFVTVISNDHVENPKPSCDGLLLAASRLKIAPEEILYVGDSAMDILCAKSAKSRSMAALWDLTAHRESLQVHDPHHWGEKPQDVWDVWANGQS